MLSQDRRDFAGLDSGTDLGSVRLGNPLRRIRVGDHYRCLAR